MTLQNLLQRYNQPRSPESSRRQTERLAWVILDGSFVLLCVLAFILGSSGWSYYRNTLVDQNATLIVRTDAGGVSWQRRDRTTFERVDGQQVLQVGDQVRVDSNAGYGQIATIRLFDQSTVDLWPGATVQLIDSDASRWSSEQQNMIVRQTTGYARYDLRADQPFQTVRFFVQAGNATIDLAPGGSYSVSIVPTDRRTVSAEQATSPLNVTDVAVRSGRLAIRHQQRSVILVPGQHAIIDASGLPSLPLLASWELVQDGRFSAYSEDAYNNTTVPGQPTLERALTWQIFSGPSGDNALPNGYFRLSSICPPPRTNSACKARERINAAWLLRSGQQPQGFVVGVRQILGADQQGIDISEYRSLQLSLWVRVLYQSLEGTGVQGTECPVMVRIIGKRSSPVDPEEERVICFYTAPPDLTVARDPNIFYVQVEPYEWRHLQVDLRAVSWLPDFRYLRGIDMYANGHDYDVRITDVSLQGSQLPTSSGE